MKPTVIYMAENRNGFVIIGKAVNIPAEIVNEMITERHVAITAQALSVLWRKLATRRKS